MWNVGSHPHTRPCYPIENLRVFLQCLSTSKDPLFMILPYELHLTFTIERVVVAPHEDRELQLRFFLRIVSQG